MSRVCILKVALKGHYYTTPEVDIRRPCWKLGVETATSEERLDEKNHHHKPSISQREAEVSQSMSHIARPENQVSLAGLLFQQNPPRPQPPGYNYW